MSCERMGYFISADKQYQIRILIKPDWLVEKVAETVTRQFETYARKE